MDVNNKTNKHQGNNPGCGTSGFEARPGWDQARYTKLREDASLVFRPAIMEGIGLLNIKLLLIIMDWKCLNDRALSRCLSKGLYKY